MDLTDIRPLEAGDLAAARELIESTGLFPADLLDDMTAPYLGGGVADDLWFVAISGQDVAALAYCCQERMTDGTWNLLLIAVRASHQGRGIGSRLTRHIEETLVNRAGRTLIVETSSLPDFDRTREIYATLGYIEVARVPEFYAAGEDKVVFWKKLKP